MPWVAFLGADGAGKSTVIEGVTRAIEGRGIEVDYQHWRPVLRPSEGEGSGPVTDPHAEAPRGRLGSWAKIVVLVGIWRVSFFRDLSRVRRAGKLVLFDRFYADLLVDPVRYRYGGGRWFAKLLFKLMPRPDLTILLDAEAEVLYARKPEVPLDKLKPIVAGYRDYIKTARNGVVVNTEQTIEAAIGDAIAAVEGLLR